MQDPRPLALFFLSCLTACVEPPGSTPPPTAPAGTSAPATGPASGVPSAAPAQVSGTIQPPEAKAAGKSDASPTRISADEVRVMVGGKLDIKATGSDKAGTQLKCMLRFIAKPSGKSEEVDALGCDEKYSEQIIKVAKDWKIVTKEGGELPHRAEVLWEIRYTLQ